MNGETIDFIVTAPDGTQQIYEIRRMPRTDTELADEMLGGISGLAITGAFTELDDEPIKAKWQRVKEQLAANLAARRLLKVHPVVSSVQEPDNDGVLNIRYWVNANEPDEVIADD